ncbi:hypothetical protein P4H66_24990 [Paenibacillus dokdonensis]|uniref:DUF4015 domain-containing protein n=1 Tax=Paenibacillus dokdonensis TaxID=2567944 RepID=A0ABU6GXC2_9BACL|nr:hypothetical protein [Paenibacillus dokdonensis]MEC0243071.1 hypothetical protein [Paenibacillus dokdonensis]
MSKWTKRIWMVIIWVGVGALIGMQLAGSGSSKADSGKKIAYADQQTAQAANTAQAQVPRKSSNHFKVEEQQPEQVEVQDWSSQSPEQILSTNTNKPTVDVLADKTAGLLQDLSQKGIRLVVSLFDSITD